MKPSSDPDFADSLLAEGLESFRSQLLAHAVRTAKRRHRVRVATRILCALALVAIIGAVINRPPRPPLMASAPRPLPAQPASYLVQSSPVPAGVLIKHPGVPADVVARTSSLAKGVLVRSDERPFESSFAEVIVKSDRQMNVPRLDDEQLLASFGGRPTALLRPPGEPPRLLLVPGPRRPWHLQ